MAVLVLRHEPFEHLGHFAAVLEENRVEYRYCDLGEPVPREDFDGLIVMGGPMSANDDLPGLRDELRLIEKALQKESPVLGICLGAQLIARALGARVYRNGSLEIGWEPVWMTQAAHEDALFRGMASPEMFFHWHGETFDLPSGAEWLAYSEKCRHQAYRYGRKTYGIQFHPEITAEMIADWCVQPVNCGDVAEVGVVDPVAHDTRGSARKMIEGWVGLL
jgi:GMP synthase (glutamine-hydrolysing)